MIENFWSANVKEIGSSSKMLRKFENSAEETEGALSANFPKHFENFWVNLKSIGKTF